MSHLGSLWAGSLGVTFESLLGHFNSFCVSVDLGARPLHNSCTGAKWGCIGAKVVLGGATDSWETLAPWGPNDLLHPPLITFVEILPFWAISQVSGFPIPV